MIIVGGGLSGLSLANALGSFGIDCVIIDKTSLADDGSTGQSDLRQTAVSYGSERLLASWGVWESALSAETCAIMSIHVRDGISSRHELVFSACERGYQHLAVIVPNDFLRACLLRGLQQHESVKLLAGRTWQAIENVQGGIDVALDDDTVLRGYLVVAADGRQSPVALQAGIDYHRYDYAQKALVAILEHELPHRGRACEFFLPQGTLALLPLADSGGKHRSSLVWSLSSAVADAVVASSPSLFAEQVAYYSDSLFGAMRLVSKRQMWHLALLRAGSYIGERIALIGDACRALHPLAGQGINLGWRDCAVLATMINESVDLGLDCGDRALLRRYERARGQDALALMAATHGLNQLFGQECPPIVGLRRLGLSTVDNVRWLRHGFMDYAMGTTCS